MKKILLTFSLLAMLITVACDTSKNSSTTNVTPVPSSQQPQAEAPAKPQKGEMKQSDMQAVDAMPYQKKAFPPKGQMRPMAATPVPDTIK